MFIFNQSIQLYPKRLDGGCVRITRHSCIKKSVSITESSQTRIASLKFSIFIFLAAAGIFMPRTFIFTDRCCTYHFITAASFPVLLFFSVHLHHFCLPMHPRSAWQNILPVLSVYLSTVQHSLVVHSIFFIDTRNTSSFV